MGGHFQDTKAAEELIPYLQNLCEGCCAGIADSVASKDERFDGGVFLSKIKHKDTVSGTANSAQNASKVFAGGGSIMWLAIFRIQRLRRN